MIFTKYDTDSSGGLSASELLELLKSYEFGYAFSPEEAAIAVQLLSKSGSSEITYKDFHAWWNNDQRFVRLRWTPEELERLHKMRDLYRKYDKDGNGIISRSEFRWLHKALLQEGFPVPAELTACLKQIDADGSGTIDFNEFVVFLRSFDAFKTPTITTEETEKKKEEEPQPETTEKSDAVVVSRKARETPEAFVARVLDKSGYVVLKAFRTYDADSSCSIGAAELRKLLRDEGFGLLGEEEAELAVKMISTRGGKEIDFTDFKSWFKSDERFKMLRWDERELARLRMARDMFDAFDVDMSGNVTPDEFKQLHAAMVEKGWPVPDVVECMKAMDEDKNGKISFREFSNFLRDKEVFFV